MAMRMTVLASGSRGNCTVLSSEQASILVDAGLSCRETLKRMRAAGEDPHRLKAIIISHEHQDHVAGLQMLARKLQIPVFITEATYLRWRGDHKDSEGRPGALERCEHFQAGSAFALADITVTPFTIPHDAADPCGFTFSSAGIKIAVVTDLGYLPANVKMNLRDCDGLMIESNHDLEMLRSGPYPWMVKQRVMSRVGHLSNAALAEFFVGEYDRKAAFLVLAHLSQENNHPELARQSASQALGTAMSLFPSATIALAEQDKPLQPFTLG
jgi:phosphoribosyl 1,2-cyclic phosphodiesterase